MKWRTRTLAALLALAFLLGACGDLNAGDGSCEPPTPCGSNQGQNP